MQTPLAYLYLKRVGFPLPDDAVVPNITTGLESFGKTGELEKIRMYTELMQMPSTWPQAVQDRTKFDIYSREIAASLSMNMPWAMTDDEWEKVQADNAKAQQNQALQEAAVKAAPEVIKQGGAQNAG